MYWRSAFGATAITLAWIAGADAASAQVATTTVLDSAGDVGAGNDVAYGPNGRALVSYRDVTNGRVKVAACQDVACTSAVISTVDPAASGVGPTSLAFGPDGRALVAYQDGTTQALKVARCADADCTAATLSTVASPGALWPGRVRIAVGADGRGLLMYGLEAGEVRMAHCADADCTSAQVTSYAMASTETSLVIGTDGRALFAGGSQIGHCGDAACTTASFVLLPSLIPGPTGFHYTEPSLAVGADGLGRVAATRVSHAGPYFDVYLWKCRDLGCSALDPVDGIVFLAARSALTVLPNGWRAFAHSSQMFVSPNQLGVTVCAGACVTRFLESGPIEVMPRAYAIAPSPASIPLVTSYDQVTRDLTVAYLDGPLPEVSIGDATLTEGDGGQTLASFEVTLSEPGDATVRFSTFGGTATTGEDYLDASGTLTFTAATPTHTVTVAVLGDRQPEPTESFRVSLFIPEGTIPVDAEGIGTIVNDDGPVLWIDDGSVAEGAAAGAVPLSFVVHAEGLDARGATVDYVTEAIDATPGVDFLPTSGTLTFAPGETARTLMVYVFGDAYSEVHERFRLRLSNPAGAAVSDPEAIGTILNDDAFGEAPLPGELSHGVSHTAELAAVGALADADEFRLAQASGASYEVVADSVSGDVRPLGLLRLPADGPVQAGVPIGTGSAVSLRWRVAGTAAVQPDVIRVTGACGDACGRDDVYRLRVYETTLRGARFSNAGAQKTVLILQNPGTVPADFAVHFWAADGTLLASYVTGAPLAPHGVVVVNTGDVPGVAGASGSVTVAHDLPYGGLVGKVLALEPATGFAFDTPLEPRPR